MPERKLITDPERVELLTEARNRADDEAACAEDRLFAQRVISFLEIEGDADDA